MNQYELEFLGYIFTGGIALVLLTLAFIICCDAFNKWWDEREHAKNDDVIFATVREFRNEIW